MRLVAIIPARAGSKGLPGKNMRALSGKPLVQHAIESAHDSGRFEEVYVTSDDDAVLTLAVPLGATPIRRPSDLASDAATMSDVVADLYATLARQNYETGEAFALLQPTSPLRRVSQVAECVDSFKSGAFASAVSVCSIPYVPQKVLAIRRGVLEPLFGWDALQENRQNLEHAYRQNGAIWLTRWDAFNRHRRFVVAPAMPFIMDETDSIDIDSEGDFVEAEQAFARVRKS